MDFNIGQVEEQAERGAVVQQQEALRNKWQEMPSARTGDAVQKQWNQKPQTYTAE